MKAHQLRVVNGLRSTSAFEDRVVKDFFRDEHHRNLFTLSIGGDQASKRMLEEAFRRHFFRIRFTRYMASTIKFYSMDQSKRHRKYSERNTLIFDRPVSQEREATTFGELYLQDYFVKESTETYSADPDLFQSSMENEKLEFGFSTLTPKQKKVLTLHYALCYRDHEIAKLFGTTPQAVSKIKNTALKKLRVVLVGRG